MKILSRQSFGLFFNARNLPFTRTRSSLASIQKYSMTPPITQDEVINFLSGQANLTEKQIQARAQILTVLMNRIQLNVERETALTLVNDAYQHCPPTSDMEELLKKVSTIVNLQIEHKLKPSTEDACHMIRTNPGILTTLYAQKPASVSPQENSLLSRHFK